MVRIKFTSTFVLFKNLNQSSHLILKKIIVLHSPVLNLHFPGFFFVVVAFGKYTNDLIIFFLWKMCKKYIIISIHGANEEEESEKEEEKFKKSFSEETK